MSFKPFALIAACAVLPVFAQTEVGFLFAYDPNHPEEPATRRILELAREDPELVPVKWGGLTLPGGGGRATFMLALAGGTAPDVYKAWFHILRHDVEQGFVYPLDEWVGAPERATDLWDRVRTFDGHVWALPTPGIAYYGIVYRKDLVRAAGLDPENPPATWRAFRDWCVQLTEPGRRAFAIENRPWGFLPWVQSAGGDVIRETDGQWEACFDSPAALKAAGFLQELVRLGVVRGLPTLTVADDIGELFVSGEIVAVFGGEDLVTRLTEVLNVPADDIGLMPFPAADEGGGQLAREQRIFGEVLKVSSAARIALEVHARREHHADAVCARLLADCRADLFQKRRIPAAAGQRGGGEAGRGHRAVQTELIARALLLADTVGTVGERHVPDPQPLHALGLPEVPPREQVALLLERKLLDQFFMFQG